MRKLILASLLVLAGACGSADQADQSVLPADSATLTMTMDAESPPPGAVRHVVAFRFTPEAPDSAIAEITDAFRALEARIPGIIGFEDGINNSPEGLNQDFTHVFTLTFESAAARDAYLPHPEHVAFGALLDRLGVVDSVFVVDYTPND